MGIAVIDLFAGAGGLGIGVSKAGGDLRLSVEKDVFACDSMLANKEFHSGEVWCEDISNISGKDLLERASISVNEPFIIVGGPPCQPFSKASYWTDSGDESRYRRARSNGEKADKPKPITQAKEDARRSMAFEFYRLIKESNPNGFLFENVPSILHPRNVETFNNLRNSLETLGYFTRLIKANGQHYGLAQKRQRIVLIGSKNYMPPEPKISHSDNLDLIAKGLKPFVMAGDVLKQFDKKKFFEEGEIVSGKWENHLKEIPPGKNYKALTAWAGHPNPSFVAETRFWNFLLKLSPKMPSWTIAASPGPWTGPFHWKSRRLRTVEMAELQGFPLGYRFIGSRREKVRQIGNALPSHIASACLNSIFETINSEQTVELI